MAIYTMLKIYSDLLLRESELVPRESEVLNGGFEADDEPRQAYGCVSVVPYVLRMREQRHPARRTRRRRKRRSRLLNCFIGVKISRFCLVVWAGILFLFGPAIFFVESE